MGTIGDTDLTPGSRTKTSAAKRMDVDSTNIIVRHRKYRGNILVLYRFGLSNFATMDGTSRIGRTE